MKRIILPLVVVSLFGITAAGAYPAPRTEQPVSTDLILEVHKKGKGHHHHGIKHGGKYYHNNKYWTHRYRYRPIGWAVYGCIAAGPFWYCP